MRNRVLPAVPALVAALGLVALVAVVPGPPAASAAPPPHHPTRLSHLAGARQVVVVTSKGWSTSYATLRTYRKGAGGRWHEKFAPMRARIGYSGFAKAEDRRQNTGKTPAGTFRILRAFGSYRDPGTALRYRVFDRNDWWPYDPRSPRTYNVYQYRRVSAAAWRTSWAEHLWDFRGQYRHAAVLDYNLPSGLYRSGGQWLARNPADTTKGGGIFLHVNGRGATAGCVSVGYLKMARIIRWLDPDKTPRIVMGPRSAITRM